MSLFCSLAICKNTNPFSRIELAWNEATYQFLQLTHNKLRFVSKIYSQLYNFIF